MDGCMHTLFVHTGVGREMYMHRLMHLQNVTYVVTVLCFILTFSTGRVR